MASPEATRGERLRFAEFELDPLSLELWRDGELVPLRPQPASVLLLLARRSGELVTREQLRDELWGTEVTVDYEHSLNSAIRQVRTALGERADSPGLLQTFPRRGYRLAAAVTASGDDAAATDAYPASDDGTGPAETDGPDAATGGVAAAAPTRSGGRGRRWLPWAAAATVAAAVVLVAWTWLRPVTVMPVSSGTRTLVVLPFVALHESQQDRLFGEGLSQEIIGYLGRLRSSNLSVIGPASALRVGGVADPATLAEGLDADFLLLGTVRSEGNVIRVTAQLVGAADRRQHWADTFEGSADETLQLQERISAGIVASLANELLIGEPGEASAGRSSSPGYSAYLAGRAAFVRGSAPDLATAVESLETAVAQDPQLAAAWAYLARAYTDSPGTPAALQGRIPEAIERALSLDRRLASAYVARARWRLEHEWDVAGALDDANTAVALEPGGADAHALRASVLSALGVHDAAIAEARRALALDPLSPTLRADAAGYLYLARRWNEAITEARVGIDLEPHLVRAWHVKLYAAMAAGDMNVAREAMLHRLRDLAVSEEQLSEISALPDEALVRRFWDLYLPWLATADVAGASAAPASLVPGLVFTGRHDEAMQALRSGAAERNARVIPFLRSAPFLDPLRDRPEFIALQASVTWPDAESLR